MCFSFHSEADCVLKLKTLILILSTGFVQDCTERYIKMTNFEIGCILFSEHKSPPLRDTDWSFPSRCTEWDKFPELEGKFVAKKSTDPIPKDIQRIQSNLGFQIGEPLNKFNVGHLIPGMGRRRAHRPYISDNVAGNAHRRRNSSPYNLNSYQRRNEGSVRIKTNSPNFSKGDVTSFQIGVEIFTPSNERIWPQRQYLTPNNFRGNVNRRNSSPLYDLKAHQRRGRRWPQRQYLTPNVMENYNRRNSFYDSSRHQRRASATEGYFNAENVNSSRKHNVTSVQIGLKLSSSGNNGGFPVRPGLTEPRRSFVV